TNAQIVRRRRYDKFDNPMRQALHSSKAILETEIEPCHTRKVIEQIRFVQRIRVRPGLAANADSCSPPCARVRARREFIYVAEMADKPSKLKIAGREFTSRLLVGTGKFSSNELMRDALVASGTEIVTVALRRADLSGKHDPYANILDFIDPNKFLLLPNTSGARNADE